jgi:hypothetical protein
MPANPTLSVDTISALEAQLRIAEENDILATNARAAARGADRRRLGAAQQDPERQSHGDRAVGRKLRRSAGAGPESEPSFQALHSAEGSGSDFSNRRNPLPASDGGRTTNDE